MKITETFQQIVEADLASGNTVFLAGEPGIGKTSIVKSMAKDAGTECFIVQVNQLADKADLTGARLLPTEDGKSFEQKFFAHHKVRGAVQYALENPHSVVYLLLDEINRTTPDVTSGALSISTERELGDQKLPDNVRIVVTGNTKGNIVALDDASLSRFVVYEVEPDASTLVSYLDSRNNGTRPCNPLVKAVLVTNPGCVFEKALPAAYDITDGDDDDPQATFMSLADASEEMLQITTPRTIEGVSDWLDHVQDTNPQLLQTLLTTQSDLEEKLTLLGETIRGHVGNTRFADLLVGEIAKAISQPQMQTSANTLAAPKPAFWSNLKSVNSHSDLDNYISGLSDNERSSALAYALYDKTDNSAIIEQLVTHIQVLNPDCNSTMTNLLTSSNLNNANLETLMKLDSPAITNFTTIVKALSGDL